MCYEPFPVDPQQKKKGILVQNKGETALEIP